MPEPKSLAAIGGIAPGDLVEWWIEDPKNFCAEQERGLVRAVRSDGPLEIPGTQVSRIGKPTDPVALIQTSDDDFGGDDYEGDCWYLVPFSALTKVVIEQESPDRPRPRLSARDARLMRDIESL
jgi:hypothetical protein